MSDQTFPGEESSKPAEPIVLRYVGRGEALPDVPARDLTQRDLDELLVRDVARLLASALYVEA
jgi:hypothetical protein